MQSEDLDHPLDICFERSTGYLLEVEELVVKICLVEFSLLVTYVSLAYYIIYIKLY